LVLVAIIGAGLAGLACADALVAAGHSVTLFDKGRGLGGRMSTRRTETMVGQACFDHGAQYFTVRHPGFARQVAAWSARGVASRWPEAGDDAWVGVPGMNAIVKDAGSRHDLEFSFIAKGLVRDGRRWQVVGEHEARGHFDAVVVATPAEQAASILSLHDFEMARAALLARSQPCWAALFAFAGPVPSAVSILRDTGAIAWAARNNAKPGRGALECWVVHANAAWSMGHLEESPETVERLLRDDFEAAVAAPLPEILYSAAHRWRYALSTGTGRGALWNEEIKLGVCGDWLLGPRVECAWLSGQELGARIASTRLPRPMGGAASNWPSCSPSASSARELSKP
jgi:renalase